MALDILPAWLPAQTPSSAIYSVVALGELRPAGATFPRSVSPCGDVVGDSGFTDGIEVSAFQWSKDAAMRSLGALPGGDFSQANAINSRGEIAGSSNTETALRAVLWSGLGSGGQIQILDLGTLPGDQSSEALAINDAGQIVGYSSGPGGPRAFIWSGQATGQGTRQNGMRDLGGLPGSDYTRAEALNSLGQAAGRSGRAGKTHAFFWTAEAGMLDLGVLPGDRSSAATSLNDSGVVVGSSTGPRGTRGFRWTREEGMSDLGRLLPGDSFVEPHAINNSGEVIGVSSGADGARPFLWTAGRGMKDLNDLIPADSSITLTGALGINRRGDIAAFGAPKGAHSHHSNAPRAFLLTFDRPDPVARQVSCGERQRANVALQAEHPARDTAGDKEGERRSSGAAPTSTSNNF